MDFYVFLSTPIIFSTYRPIFLTERTIMASFLLESTIKKEYSISKKDGHKELIMTAHTKEDEVWKK